MGDSQEVSDLVSEGFTATTWRHDGEGPVRRRVSPCQVRYATDVSYCGKKNDDVRAQPVAYAVDAVNLTVSGFPQVPEDVLTVPLVLETDLLDTGQEEFDFHAAIRKRLVGGVDKVIGLGLRLGGPAEVGSGRGRVEDPDVDHCRRPCPGFASLRSQVSPGHR